MNFFQKFKLLLDFPLYCHLIPGHPLFAKQKSMFCWIVEWQEMKERTNSRSVHWVFKICMYNLYRNVWEWKFIQVKFEHIITQGDNFVSHALISFSLQTEHIPEVFHNDFKIVSKIPLSLYLSRSSQKDNFLNQKPEAVWFSFHHGYISSTFFNMYHRKTALMRGTFPQFNWSITQ